ncbi:MAG: tryptophan synthase subunit alpha [Lachnospiraceae bacterium]|nr:tryptophan synthase subunit alpha [Agathobacter sp.]MDD6445437.1 tryptophan synthase subunit alpha [Lachnospiraceae bacterium]MDY4894139.1 tryptophan synthase subunit alpha [Agathobacter sp.]
MNRIENALSTLQDKKEKAFITYITAGLPDYGKTKEIIKAQEKAGTDIIELGIPFSDPVADGPVIQAASYEAIQGGANLEKTFALMKEMRDEGVEIPIVFMMYYNTVLHYGLEKFVKECGSCGVDGLIIPDLPLEEQEEIKEFLDREDKTILIELVSPVSKDRIPKILENARGFVYCVSSMGVTGQEASFHREVMNYLADVKKQSKIPVMMGFGIRTAEDVRPMKDIIDGAIVGSHFITLMREHNFDPQTAADYCSTFKKELNVL